MLTYSFKILKLIIMVWCRNFLLNELNKIIIKHEFILKKFIIIIKITKLRMVTYIEM